MEAMFRMGGYVCLLLLAMAGVPGAAEFATPNEELEKQQPGQLGQVCACLIAGISVVVTLAIWQTACLRWTLEYPVKKLLLSEFPSPHSKTPQDQINCTKIKNARARSQGAMMQTADSACLLCGNLCFADSGTCAACSKRMLCGVLHEGMKLETKAQRCHEGRQNNSAIEGGRGRKLVSSLVPPPRSPIVDGIVGASFSDGSPTTDETSTKGPSLKSPPGLSPLPPVTSSTPVDEDDQRQCSEERNHVTETTANNDIQNTFARLMAAVNASLADNEKAAVAKATGSRAATNEELMPHHSSCPLGGVCVGGQVAPASMIPSKAEVATNEHQLPVVVAEGPLAGQPEADRSSESSELPSRGADKHAQGDCTPCYFFSTARGCQWGSDCGFCHLGHEKEIKQRPSKARRERTKKLVDNLVIDSQSGQALETLTSQSQHMNERNRRYFNQVIVKKLSRLEGSMTDSSQQPGDHLDETPPPSQAGCSSNCSSSRPSYIRPGAKAGHSGNRLEKPHPRAGKKTMYQPAGAGNSKKSMHCMWYFSV